MLVRLLPNKRTDRREVLLLERGTEALSVTALRSVGLTARQAQTLRLAALGHTATQTATQMGIAPRTVEKHLQHIYGKLGVTSPPASRRDRLGSSRDTTTNQARANVQHRPPTQPHVGTDPRH